LALALGFSAVGLGVLLALWWRVPAVTLPVMLAGWLLLLLASRRLRPEPARDPHPGDLPLTVSERASEARKIVLAASRSDNAVLIFDTERRLEWVNDVYTRLSGLGLEQVAGLGPERFLFGPDTDPATAERVGGAIDAGEGVSVEVMNRDPSGRCYWLAFEVQPILTASGRVASLIAIGRDITDRKLAEEALRASELQVRTIIETTPECVKLVAADGTLLEINPAGMVIIEAASPDEVVGRSVYDLIAPAHRESYRQFNERVCAGRGETLEFELVGLKGTRRWMESHASPLGDTKHGSVVQLGLARDISARKQAEAEMERARAAALEAARVKSEFLANVSHEIRTPMNGIIGMTEIALDSDPSPEQKQCLETIRSSAQALLVILNDVLDFSKIEAGRLELETIPFRCRDLFRDTLRPLAVQAHAKGLELACEIAPELPDSLRGDPGRLRQILLNLVGNAIKFTERGEVAVRLDVERLDEDEVRVHFEIADTGIGIPASKKDLIFDAFAQADGSTTRKYGGTGLGLAIVSQLVGMMDGRVWVESEPERGSRFHCTLALSVERNGQPPLGVEGPENLASLRVLVVDDNATSRRILSSMLESWGIRTVCAADGEEALAALRESSERGTSFDLVLLDARMPTADGFEIARRMRDQIGPPPTPIVLLTTSGFRGDAARCRELGIGAYLTKPILPSDLLGAMRTILAPAGAESDRGLVTKHSLRERLPRLRILLAEDDAVNRTVARTLLERCGHAVLAVEDGVQALDALESGAFDIALLDAQMPRLGGIEVTAAVRERERHTGRHLPIAALTAYALDSDRERCLAAGMDGYLSKPIVPEALYTEIARLTGSADARGRAGRPEPQPLPVFDRRGALSVVDGDEGLLGEIVSMFLAETPRMRAEISRAADSGNETELERALQPMLGALGTIAARAAEGAARELETLSRSSPLGDAKDALARLDFELARLEPELRALDPSRVEELVEF
jgi:PAS domain S-box-containing protein